jgi:hypothetical protein
MRRKLFTLAAGASAALCIAVGLLLVWSRDARHSFSCQGEMRGVEIQFVPRRCIFTFATSADGVRDVGDGWFASHSISPGENYMPLTRFDDILWGAESGSMTRWDRFGFSLESSHDATMSARRVGVPWWFLMLASGALPALWCIHRARIARASKRQAGGLCPSCGYDLRATPDRCPECGSPAPTKGAA